jgi:predicted transcriptional regulator
MIQILTAAQSRAARGWLNWSQMDLAKSSMLGRKTIAEFESGATQPQDRTLRDMRRAFEDAGIEFTYDDTKPDGFRARPQT